MLLSRALMKALILIIASALALAESFGSSNASRFSSGKCSAKSLRSARKTPLCASFAGGGIGGTRASASRLPTTVLASMSAAFAGLPILAPMAGGGLSAPVSSPASDIRAELSAIFGSVPTATTGVRHAPGTSTEAWTA